MCDLADLADELGTTLCEGGGYAEALGEAKFKPVKECGLGLVGADDAADADVACGVAREGQDDVCALDGTELVENRARTISESGTLLPNGALEPLAL
jgi:hypothetical protein